MLERLFSKVLDGRKKSDANVRQKVGIISGTVGIVVNGLIFLIEIIVGGIVNSVAVTADAFHNLTDVISSIITIVSFRIAGKPADKKHPFGHGRIEYISALFVAMVIIVIGFEFIRTSIEKIIHPSNVIFNLLSLILILVSIVLKLSLSFFSRKLGNLINSSTIKATAFDALSDVFVLSVASLSLILSAFSNIHVDGYLGVVVALFIMYSGFTIAKSELNPLLGEAPDKELVKNIIEGVLKAKYVSGTHDLIIHNYGPNKYMATIHAEVPCNEPVLKIHESIDSIEKELSEELGIILVIHMDPINSDDETVKKAKKVVIEVIKSFPHVLSMHDFRVVGDGSSKNVIFDIVVDNSVKTENDELSLCEDIGKAVKSKSPEYNTVINVDRNYVSE